MTEFEKYLKQTRGEFAYEVSKYTVENNLALRTASDSLLIAFDQATEKAINYTRCSLKLKDDIDEFSELTRTFIKEVDKKHPFVNLPEEEDFYLARHKLVDKLNDL